MSKVISPDKQQEIAIKHFKGPAIVIAGPGTGKTYVITKRVENLIREHNISPENILVTTFTEKAADELKSRIIHSLKDVEFIESLHVSTIHSLCAQILREFGEYHKYGTTFEVIDDLQQVMLIIENKFYLFKGRNFQLRKIDEVLSFFNRCSENDVDPQALLKAMKNKRDEECILVAEAYSRYLKLLEKNGLLDFPNLQREVLHLIRNNKTVAKKLRERFKFILVDEYQDTNPIQAEIFYELSKPNFNIFVVGDEDQSIYGFRGADVKQFRNFERRYNSKKIKLSINYRSTKSIIQVSEDFIKKYRKVSKKIVPHRTHECDQPKFVQKESITEEADTIAYFIKYLKKSGLVESYSDIAVLGRTKEVLRGVRGSLENEGIPYSFGKHELTENELVKSLIYLLRFISPEKVKCSLFHWKGDDGKRRGKSWEWWSVDTLDTEILNLSQRTIEALKNKAFDDIFSIKSLDVFVKNGVSRRDAEKLFKLIRLRDKIKQKIESGRRFPILERYYELLRQTGYLKKLIKNKNKPEFKSKLLILAELSKLIKRFEGVSKSDDVYKFMWTVYLLYNSKLKPEIELPTDKGVKLLTIHQSKGLEFPVVIIPFSYKRGARKSKFEVPKSLLKSGDFNQDEEERRVYYVGMTRAIDLLVITTTKNKGSELIKDLNTKLLDVGSFQVKYPISKQGTKEANAVEKISFSSMGVFKSCPLRYELQYILGFKTPQTFEQYKGKLIHNILYKINQELLLKKSLSEQDVINTVKANWKPLWKDRRKDKIAKDRIIQNAIRYLSFFKREVSEILKIEHEFNFPLRNLNLSHTFERYLLTTKVDMIYKDKQGSPVLIDFKSRTKEGIKTLDIKHQLSLYYLALENEYPNLKFASYAFEDGEVVSFSRKEVNKKRAIEYMIRFVSSYERGIFKPKENPFCKNCAFRGSCGVK